MTYPSRFRVVAVRRLLVSLLALVGLCSLATGCATDPQVIAQANNIHQEIEPSVVRDPELAGYVQAVGDRIVNTAREMHAAGELEGEPWMFENIKFHLVASPTPNAFTTGGTHVYLYSQLFDEAGSEDAFAAVVGHEFGHIVGRHVQQSMNRQMAILAGAGLAGLGAAALTDENRAETGMQVAGLAAGVGTLFGMGFGRDNEREADELGFRMYVRSGYDPDKFPDFFRTMIEAGYDSPGGVQQYLSSHPRLAERVETAERMAANVSEEERRRYARPPVASPEQFAALKQQSQQATAQAAAAVTAAKAGARSEFIEALAVLEAFPACVGGPADDVPPEDQPGAQNKIVPPQSQPQQEGRISQPANKEEGRISRPPQ